MDRLSVGNHDGAENGNKSLLRLLLDPASYPEPTTQVEQIDTHISSVFITDRFVYKLKKPVRFDFLDFSTLEKRHEACNQELHLNRRLARDTYLAVVPINATDGSARNSVLTIGGEGEPVDWLVKMRRLPKDRSLDQLIRAHQLANAEVNALASTLVTFFQRLPPLSIRAETYHRRIAQHVEANDQVLFRWAGDTSFELAAVKRVHQAQRRLLELAPDLFDARVCDGRIIDGHGDLRPEHIYYNPHPVVIDCIEFNDEFRQLDILDELAFLAIECEQLNAPWIGDEILGHYQTTSRDGFPTTLLEFYKSYRASVRAKVLALRAKQLDGSGGHELHEAVSAYVQCAGNHAARLGPPALLVTYGLPGTGKSTLATSLAEKLGIEVLRSDEIRRSVVGDQVPSSEFNQGAYEPAKRMAVYQEMFRRAELALACRLSVVLDGTFSTAALRQQAFELARREGAVLCLAHCHCPPEIALERIASRSARGKSLSDETEETYQRLSTNFEPDPADLPVCCVDTTEGGTAMLREVFAKLRKELLAT